MSHSTQTLRAQTIFLNRLCVTCHTHIDRSRSHSSTIISLSTCVYSLSCVFPETEMDWFYVLFAFTNSFIHTILLHQCYSPSSPSNGTMWNNMHRRASDFVLLTAQGRDPEPYYYHRKRFKCGASVSCKWINSHVVATKTKYNPSVVVSECARVCDTKADRGQDIRLSVRCLQWKAKNK